MTKLWAISLYALSLGSAAAGCASSPLSGREDGGEQTTIPSDVVVIGSQQDTGTPEGGSAQPDAGPSMPATDAGVRANDAALVDAGPAQTGEGTTPTSDAGTQTSEPDARTPAEPVDAGGPVSEPGDPPDAGSEPALDAAAPPVEVDAAQPVEQDAGKVGCLPGIYKGAFEGEISALLGLVRIDVAGDITIEVELGETEGDRLTIRNGVLQGTDTSEQKNPISARIGGVLNCATKRLEGGTITEGAYTRVDPLYPFNGPTTTTFSGTINGLYATEPPAAIGTWMVENGSGTRTSMGTWNAALE